MRPHNERPCQGPAAHAPRLPALSDHAAAVSPRGYAGDLPGSLADLGRLAQAGCTRALDRLLRQVEGPLYRYLIGQLRAAPDAEDLARDLCQETLIRTAVSLQRCTFASDARLLAWVLTIARNLLVDHLRRARDRREVRDDAGLAHTPDAGWPPQDDAPRPRLLETFAAEALAEVSEDTARLLRLRLVEGESWKEVGRALGIAESAAKRRFQRAQATLRRSILARVEALPAGTRHAASLRLVLPGDAPPGGGAALRSHGARLGRGGGHGQRLSTHRIPETRE
jgi:RNA polymerase sigma-70 factor (ECF subfamily)